MPSLSLQKLRVQFQLHAKIQSAQYIANYRQNEYTTNEFWINDRNSNARKALLTVLCCLHHRHPAMQSFAEPKHSHPGVCVGTSFQVHLHQSTLGVFPACLQSPVPGGQFSGHLDVSLLGHSAAAKFDPDPPRTGLYYFVLAQNH